MFNTTDIGRENPALYFNTPEAMPAKFNSTTAGIKLARTGLDMATKFDKKQVLGEARDTANALADDYLTGSETNINNLTQEQARLQNDLKDPAVSNSVEIMKKLEELQDKISLANEQGLIGPGEMKHRMMAAAQDLSNQNPAYQEEISKKMNSVFSATGVNDIIAMDSTLLVARQKRQAAIYDERETYLNRFMDASKLTEEQKVMQASRLRDLEGGTESLKALNDNLKGQDENTKQKALIEFRSQGGMGKLRTMIYSNISETVRSLSNLDDPKTTTDDKVRLINDQIEGAKTMLSDTITSMPTNAANTVTQVQNLITSLEAIKTEFLDTENKTHAINELKGKLDYKTKNQELDTSKKYNMSELIAQEKIVKIVNTIRVGAQDQEKVNKIITSLTDNMLDTVNGMGTMQEDLGENQDMLSQIVNKPEFKAEAEKDLKKNGELDDTYKNTITGSLQFAQATKAKVSLLSWQDTYLHNTIMSMPDNVFKVMEQDSKFISIARSQLQTFNTSAGTSLQQILNQSKLGVSVNKTTGTIRMSNGQANAISGQQANEINKRLQRINQVIRMEARLGGVTPAEALEDLMTNEYSFLVLDGAK